MITFKEEILCTLLECETADLDMLEDIEYDFEDILDYIETFKTRDEIRFNDILLGAIDLFRRNIEYAIEKKLEEKRADWKYYESFIDDGSYSTNDILILENTIKEVEELENLSVCDDIEYYTNYLDNGVFIQDKETRKIYKKYLSEIIEEENDNLGFTRLDLD